LLIPYHNYRSAAEPKPKESEYRPQRKYYYSNLAFFAPWQAEYPNPRCSLPKNLCKPRKLSNIAVHAQTFGVSYGTPETATITCESGKEKRRTKPVVF